MHITLSKGPGKLCALQRAFVPRCASHIGVRGYGQQSLWPCMRKKHISLPCRRFTGHLLGCSRPPPPPPGAGRQPRNLCFVQCTVFCRGCKLPRSHDLDQRVHSGGKPSPPSSSRVIFLAFLNREGQRLAVESVYRGQRAEGQA